MNKLFYLLVAGLLTLGLSKTVVAAEEAAPMAQGGYEMGQTVTDVAKGAMAEGNMVMENMMNEVMNNAETMTNEVMNNAEAPAAGTGM